MRRPGGYKMPKSARQTKTDLELEKLRAEIDQIRQNIRREKAAESIVNLKAKVLRKPWWKQQPIKVLTVAVALLSAILGFRPSAADENKPRRPPAPISDEYDKNKHPNEPYLPPGGGDQMRVKYLTYKVMAEETEEQRWRRLLSKTPDDVKAEIDGALKDAEEVFGPNIERDIVKNYIQSRLESMHRTDPIWPTYIYKFNKQSDTKS
jgi:hypothetical protein